MAVLPLPEEQEPCFPETSNNYRQRAAAERKNLTTAKPNVAAIHEELVRLYEERVEQKNAAPHCTS